mgnify:CR=1 FL=1
MAEPSNAVSHAHAYILISYSATRIGVHTRLDLRVTRGKARVRHK